MPDHADLVVWLVEQLESTEAERDRLLADSMPVPAQPTSWELVDALGQLEHDRDEQRQQLEAVTEQLPQLHACREIVEALAKQDGPYCGVCGRYGDHASNCLRVQARLVLDRNQRTGEVIVR